MVLILRFGGMLASNSVAEFEQICQLLLQFSFIDLV